MKNSLKNKKWFSLVSNFDGMHHMFFSDNIQYCQDIFDRGFRRGWISEFSLNLNQIQNTKIMTKQELQNIEQSDCLIDWIQELKEKKYDSILIENSEENRIVFNEVILFYRNQYNFILRQV